MRIGLIPKSKHKIAIHPDRVYLMLTLKEIDELFNDVSLCVQLEMECGDSSMDCGDSSQDIIPF